jgi:hypothetical protein
MRQQGNRWAAPRWKRYWLLSQSIGIVLLTRLGLRLCGFNRWYAFLKRVTKHTHVRKLARATPAVEATIQMTLQAMRRTTRYRFVGGNCLSRSLALWWLLYRQGIACDLRIGVRKQDSQFQAHAWIEYQGQPLNEHREVHQHYFAFSQAIVPNRSLANVEHTYQRIVP